MLKELESTFLLSLANMLTGTRADTQAVSNALELICGEFSFECALLFETDFSNRFCLMERFGSCPVAFDQNFSMQEFSTQDRDELLQNDFLLIQRDAQNTPLEIRFLEEYHAESLVLVPVVDEDRYIGEEWNLYGMVVLSSSTCPVLLDELETKLLYTSVSMLIHYTVLRIYKKRIDQNRITLEKILDNTGIDIYVNDFYNHDILYVNKSMAAPYGGRKMFQGQKCWRVLFPGQTGPCDFCPAKNLIDQQGLPTKVYTWDYQRALDGLWFRVFSSTFYWVDGRLAHIISSANITENKQNEAIIENMANYDQLTKLPNRRMLVKECERRIDKATATEQGYLLFFDIDGFKAINDNFGHDAGDEFLIKLGEFFSSIPLLLDSIYRNGGDEFVAIIGGEGVTKDHIRSLASFIHQRFKSAWQLKNGTVFCNTSIGVACYPEDGVTAEPLLQVADKAMYQVKKSGGGALCFGYQLSKAQK